MPPGGRDARTMSLRVVPCANELQHAPKWLGKGWCRGAVSPHVSWSGRTVIPPTGGERSLRGSCADPHGPKGPLHMLVAEATVPGGRCMQTWSTLGKPYFTEAGCRMPSAAVAQLVARRSHNPKVGSSILTCRISFRGAGS